MCIDILGQHRRQLGKCIGRSRNTADAVGLANLDGVLDAIDGERPYLAAVRCAGQRHSGLLRCHIDDGVGSGEYAGGINADAAAEHGAVAADQNQHPAFGGGIDEGRAIGVDVGRQCCGDHSMGITRHHQVIVMTLAFDLELEVDTIQTGDGELVEGRGDAEAFQVEDTGQLAGDLRSAVTGDRQHLEDMRLIVVADHQAPGLAGDRDIREGRRSRRDTGDAIA